MKLGLCRSPLLWELLEYKIGKVARPLHLPSPLSLRHVDPSTAPYLSLANCRLTIAILDKPRHSSHKYYILCIVGKYYVHISIVLGGFIHTKLAFSSSFRIFRCKDS